MRSKIEIQFANKLIEQEFGILETNDRSLPGTPDVVYKEAKLAIFFNGCYWHSHHCRTSSSNPKWTTLLQDIQANDRVSTTNLHEMGYETLIIWECEWKRNPLKVLEKIKNRLYFSQPRKVSRRKCHTARLN